MPLALKTALWKSLLSTLWFEFPNFQELSTVSPIRWIIPVSSSSALKMILTVFHHHSHWLWFPLFELNTKFGLGCGRKIGNEGWKWRSTTMTLLSVFRLCNVKSFPWGLLCTFYSVKSSHASSKTLFLAGIKFTRVSLSFNGKHYSETSHVPCTRTLVCAPGTLCSCKVLWFQTKRRPHALSISFLSTAHESVCKYTYKVDQITKDFRI